jgi:branched-chain amino acid transport system ATP-binding protein
VHHAGSGSTSNVGILLIEQNVQFAQSVASRYAVLELGEIVDRGSFSDASAGARIASFLSV